MSAPQCLTFPHLKYEKMEVTAPALPTSELFWGLNQIKYTEGYYLSREDKFNPRLKYFGSFWYNLTTLKSKPQNDQTVSKCLNCVLKQSFKKGN